jgi:uncharacterized protein YndB with AHSA1/START domain
VTPLNYQPDPQLDLAFERIVDIPPELVWAAWTTPEHVKHWFTPAPWQTVDCDINLCPGGMFRTVMRSPEGQEFPNIGCYLEIIPGERLVWTNALEPGYRPTSSTKDDSFSFTAILALEPHDHGTKYTALVMHGDESSCKKHQEMGFYEGWGKALDQLVAYMKKSGL